MASVLEGPGLDGAAQRDRPLHGAPFPPGRLHPTRYAAEFAGTALLVGVGVSIVIIMFAEASPLPALLPSPGLRRFLTGLLFGSVGALIAVSPIGSISGAHLNPAVTLAFWLEGKLAWRDAVLYAVAQFAGGIAGAAPLLGWGALGRSVDFGATLPGAGVPLWGGGARGGRDHGPARRHDLHASRAPPDATVHPAEHACPVQRPCLAGGAG